MLTEIIIPEQQKTPPQNSTRCPKRNATTWISVTQQQSYKVIPFRINHIDLSDLKKYMYNKYE